MPKSFDYAGYKVILSRKISIFFFFCFTSFELKPMRRDNSLKQLQRGGSGNFGRRAYSTSAKKRLEPHNRRGPGPAQRAGDQAPSPGQEGPGGTPAPFGAPDKGWHAGALALLPSAQDTPKQRLVQTEPHARACRESPAWSGAQSRISVSLSSPRDPKPLSTLSRAEKGAAQDRGTSQERVRAHLRV